jgi:hypothetical protein
MSRRRGPRSLSRCWPDVRGSGHEDRPVQTQTGGRGKRMNHQARPTQAREIRAAIGRILLQDWDPIGVRDVPEAQDEYDSYVGGVYGLLVSGASPQAVAEHLCAVERERMALGQRQPADLLLVAEKLCRLDVRLAPE